MARNNQRKSKTICAALSTALVMNSLGITSAYASENGTYRDGVYEGKAKGFNGDIIVSVTVSEGNITAIDVLDNKETPAYLEEAKAVIPEIIAAGKTEGVDAVSGATYSSEGIKRAVDNALEKSAAPECFTGGSGSETDPFLITSAEGLAAFADSVDGGNTYAGKFIALDADIDLSGIENWNPIGAEGTASKNLDKIFAGNFDGRGHVVKGLTIKTEDGAPYTDEQNIGLFSVISSTAKVSGIVLEDVRINVAGEKVVRAGGVTGDITSNAVSGATAAASVDSCKVSGEISAKTDAAMVMTGGVIGRAAGNAVVSNCSSDTKISSSSGTKIAYGAGIVSMTGNDTYIVNCVNTGDITVVTETGFSLYAGGISGMMTSAQYNCLTTGNVSAGTIAQSDALSGAGLVNGALMPAASGEYTYYLSGSKITYIGADGSASDAEAVSHGSGSMNSEGTFNASAVTGEQISNGEMASVLNDNLYSVSKKLKESNADTDLKLWKTDDSGKTILSDEVYVNTTVDTSLFEEGDGSKESPYKIKTADQLRKFAVSLSEHIDYTDKYIELSGDIDLSGAEWTPIGQSSFAFNGSFDGKGYTVSGMTVGSAETAKVLEKDVNYIGFFSILGTNAVVKNLKLTNVLVNVSYESSAYAGGITAVMDSDDKGYKGAVIDSCSVDGSITITADSGNSFAAGIASYVYKGAIINCRSDVKASCTVKTGASYGETGGIAALINRALVANCYSLGSVYGSGNREDEGMGIASSLVAVNAGYVVNCYGNGGHETNDYSIYTGALSGWITGIGHTYDCYYNSDAAMKIGETVVDPVADVGTRVSSGVSDDGMVYTGGVVFNNEAYSSKQYSSVADKLNGNFKAFPVDITAFGLTNNSLKTWNFGTEVTFTDEYAEASYVQPEAEIVKKPELALNDGTWYGRDKEKSVVVTITVKDGKIEKAESSDGSTEGKAYDEALQTAKDKSTYNDRTSYAAADVSVFAGGKGTAEDPYIVNSEKQLRYIAEAMNEDVDWENIWFALDEDIVLTGGEWLPIGHAIQAEINGQKENFSVYPFRGNFDGRNHTITGLTIGSAEKPSDIYLSGLFGLAAGAHDTNLTPEAGERLVNIVNVNLKDVSINVDSRYEANAGGIAAWAQNGFVIDNCSVTGTINVNTRESFARVGGLVGSALRGVITDSYTDTEIKASTGTSSVYAGGLAGMTNRSTQVNCYTLGNITANAESNNKATVGGLTGMSGGTNINCFTYGNVESLITTVDVGGVNGRCAGIGVDYGCSFNSSASHKNAGKEIAEKAVSGTKVGEEIKCAGKTSDEMASKDFEDTLNANRTDMTAVLKEVSTYLEDMTENNKEGLSHFLFYTGDGSDLNTWAASDKTPVFGAEEPVKVDESKWVASGSELCEWAVKDYQNKNGASDAIAEITSSKDSSVEITVKDSNGEVLDKYVVDPETGKGVNSSNESVNLPQTGNNSVKDLFTVIGAFMLMMTGLFAVKAGGLFRRKRSE